MKYSTIMKYQSCCHSSAALYRCVNVCSAQYPLLAKLSETGRAALFSKLPPTTEPSFLQWCRNFKVEASVGKGSDDELSRSAGRDSDRLAAVTAAMQGAAI